MNYKKKLLNNTVKVLFENKVKNESDKYFGRDKHQKSCYCSIESRFAR